MTVVSVFISDRSLWTETSIFISLLQQSPLYASLLPACVLDQCVCLGSILLVSLSGDRGLVAKCAENMVLVYIEFHYLKEIFASGAQQRELITDSPVIGILNPLPR